MGRKNLSVKRRKEIIQSFYRIAKKIGLENTSIAKVAEDMAISNGLVMHYFKTKDELLIGLNAYILEKHLKIVNSIEYGAMDNRKSLESFITSLFSRKWNTYFDDGVFYSCYALIYRKEDFNHSFRNYLEKLHQVLQLKLHEAKSYGVILNDNISEITEVIFALIDGAYYYLGMFDQKDDSYNKQEELYIKYAIQLLNFSSNSI
ncbi:TetR family transcriptional regulator [Zunongwangia endophytica]|uniref:Biofilm operon icaADBC HTH-type negative transcriptional regulator IcaR n=1 Tax=Zunongwangia endophytica TaxID=1808945 RepID=A0ABV8H8S8_9FLAO|nr:TetR family transcriptional regulator [Zunongwangia endophytica]MDN3594368.1 TetR family transcriptional regulator [Zunongwangia endophytica]